LKNIVILSAMYTNMWRLFLRGDVRYCMLF